MNEIPAPETVGLAETEHYAVWMSREEGETLYHLELGPTTLHFFTEEWQELRELFTALNGVK